MIKLNHYFTKLNNSAVDCALLSELFVTQVGRNVKRGGALVESIAFNRRVVGSTPALAAT